LVASRTRAFDREELVERLVAADVLTAPIKTIDEVSSDPQLRHNGMLAEVEHATLGPVTVTGVPVKLGSTPGSVRLAPPVHGQHTRELLAELGYDDDAVEQLLSSRVAGAA
jgi:crotonobetainyl-CoA:carnitine CoA-transferase CaiB-like acyl-CoA transferase